MVVKAFFLAEALVGDMNLGGIGPDDFKSIVVKLFTLNRRFVISFTYFLFDF